MAYLDHASPEPTLDDAPFWRSCQDRVLRIQCCGACRAFRHPPVPYCPHCRSDRVEWIAASGEGCVFSYTIVHHPVFPELATRVPYNIALVELADCGGVRLVSNVVDVAPEAMRIGLPVRVVWEAARTGQLVPRFRVAPSTDR